MGVGVAIVAGVALYRNWDKISKFFKKIWKGIIDFIKSFVQK